MRELEDSAVWNEPERAQQLGKERVALESIVGLLSNLASGLDDCSELVQMAAEESDEETLKSVNDDLEALEGQIATLEFRRMFSGEQDQNSAFVDIQSGSGGTEAQDWAEIGEYAFGWLRTESGVHRLVRKSPFDSSSRRHTSFAAVFVAPEVDDSVEIEINPADLRIDVYRASGAGGQHVNRTESAENDRSQHKNKDQAMKQLKAKLYELEMQKRRGDQQALEDSKSDIGWGSQIRSYVLDQSRIKDLRTNVETGNTQAVLDGDLDQFIEASLKSGL